MSGSRVRAPQGSQAYIQAKERQKPHTETGTSANPIDAKKAFPYSARMIPSYGFMMEKVSLTSRVVNRDGRIPGDATVPLFSVNRQGVYPAV